MNYAKIAVLVVAASQLVLGILFLLWPGIMYHAMGIPVPMPGTNYILAMFAARLLVFGAVLVVIRRRLDHHGLWLVAMAAIQMIDFAAGVYFVSAGNVALSDAAFPMVNAVVFAAAMLMVRVNTSTGSCRQECPRA